MIKAEREGLSHVSCLDGNSHGVIQRFDAASPRPGASYHVEANSRLLKEVNLDHAGSSGLGFTPNLSGVLAGLQCFNECRFKVVGRL